MEVSAHDRVCAMLTREPGRGLDTRYARGRWPVDAAIGSAKTSNERLVIRATAHPPIVRTVTKAPERAAIVALAHLYTRFESRAGYLLYSRS